MKASGLKCDPNLGYDVVVTYGEKDGNATMELVANNQRESVTLRDLRSCTEYDVTVDVRNTVQRKSNNTLKRVMTDSMSMLFTKNLFRTLC